jgi:hypothetical protein
MYTQPGKPKQLGTETKLIEQRFRRILVRLQGASKVAYHTYSAFGATQKADQKTSKMGQVI